MRLDNLVTGREIDKWLDDQRKLHGRNDINRIDTSWWVHAKAILPVTINDIFWEQHERPTCEYQDQIVEIANLSGEGSLEQIFTDGGVPQNNSYLKDLPVRSWRVAGVFHRVVPLAKNGDHWVAQQNASGTAVTRFGSRPENALQIQLSDGRVLNAKGLHLYFDCMGQTFFKVTA